MKTLNRLILPLILFSALVSPACGVEHEDVDAEESDLARVPAPAPERDETLRNRAVAAQLALTDKTTEANWLGTGKNQFLTLYLPDSSGNPFVNALILHDNLHHPDWPGVVRHLRNDLTKGGWNTLSIAVPDYRPKADIPPLERVQDQPDMAPEAELDTQDELDTEATEPPGMRPEDESDKVETGTKPEQVPEELAERIGLASQYLGGKNNLPLVVIAVGSSATMLMQQASTGSLDAISGLVIIDPVPLPELDGFELGTGELNLRIPVLDIAPDFYPRSDPQRRAENARRQQQKLYQQRILKGSKRDFGSAEPRLVKAIRGWAERVMQRR